MTAESLDRKADGGLLADAAAGLWCDPPVLPAKWLYDERGSKLFDEITRLPEYYPTRREAAILTAHAADVVAATGAHTIIEFGSGTSTKTRKLLSAFAAHAESVAGATPAPAPRYVPVDVSTEILEISAAILAADYPSIEIEPLAGDFTDTELQLPGTPGERLVVFLGGTIGNFDDAQRSRFLLGLAQAMSPGDTFLLGADLIKDTGRLVAAYNDKSGVTADFNKNVIEVLRTGLDARGLYADDFDHIARWNPAQHRIEMWLRTRRDVRAYLAALDREWLLPAGTEMRTEISTKFDRATLSAELSAVGLSPVASWTDPFGDFVVTLTRR